MEEYQLVIITTSDCPSCIEFKRTGDYDLVLSVADRIGNINVTTLMGKKEIRRSKTFIRTRMSRWVPTIFLMKSKYYHSEQSNSSDNSDMNRMVRKSHPFNYSIVETNGKYFIEQDTKYGYDMFEEWLNNIVSKTSKTTSETSETRSRNRSRKTRKRNNTSRTKTRKTTLPRDCETRKHRIIRRSKY